MTNMKYGVGLWPELPPSPPGGSIAQARGRQHAACVSQTAPVSQEGLTLRWVETDWTTVRLFPYSYLYLYPLVGFQMGWDKFNNAAIGRVSCSQCGSKAVQCQYQAKNILQFVTFAEKHHSNPPQSLTSSQFCPSHCIFISAASYAMGFYIGPQGFLGWTEAVKNVWHSDPIAGAHPKLGGDAFQIPSLVGPESTR